MLSIRNKLRKRLRGIGFIVLATLLMTSALCVSIFAETSGIVSDIMPNGTNIPDTNIGGSTGMDGTTPLETIPEALPDKENGTVQGSNSSSAPAMIEDGDMTNNVGKILGIIIAVIVVLAVIALIIALVPKKDRYFDDKRKK